MFKTKTSKLLKKSHFGLVLILSLVLIQSCSNETEKSKITSDSLSPKISDSDSGLPTPHLDSTMFHGTDSIPVTDEKILGLINGFLNKYSKLNLSGNVDEYLKLYSVPTILGDKVYDFPALKSLATNYFSGNKTVLHYFENTKSFMKLNQEFIVYTRENQDCIEIKTDKFLSVAADKRFILLLNKGKMVCKEMKMLSFEKK